MPSFPIGYAQAYPQASALDGNVFTKIGILFSGGYY